MGEERGRLFDKVLGCLLGGEIGDAMGAPGEGKTYQQIADEFGEITEFAGSGTDDSALKHILCDAIQSAEGHPTADDWAAEWLAQEHLFLRGRLFWTPVMNGFWKLRGQATAPREAGRGNMASSSSAMCISPMGIINAGDPRRAALETFDVASLIHHDFCRDAACSMAAAVAAALHPEATVTAVLQAAVMVLPPVSAAVMRRAIERTLALARDLRDYARFRAAYYEERIIPGTAMADSRETVPVALALFWLAEGSPAETIIWGANFGRDADTIASMAGALAGALAGASAMPQAWIEQVRSESTRDHVAVSRALVDLVERRLATERKRVEAVEGLL